MHESYDGNSLKLGGNIWLRRLTWHSIRAAVLLNVGFILSDRHGAGFCLIGAQCLPLLQQAVLILHVVLHICLHIDEGQTEWARERVCLLCIWKMASSVKSMLILSLCVPVSCGQWRCPCLTALAPHTRREYCCVSWGWPEGHHWTETICYWLSKYLFRLLLLLLLSHSLRYWPRSLAFLRRI